MFVCSEHLQPIAELHRLEALAPLKGFLRNCSERGWKFHTFESAFLKCAKFDFLKSVWKSCAHKIIALIERRFPDHLQFASFFERDFSQLLALLKRAFRNLLDILRNDYLFYPTVTKTPDLDLLQPTSFLERDLSQTPAILERILLYFRHALRNDQPFYSSVTKTSCSDRL